MELKIVAAVATTLVLHIIIAFGFLHHQNSAREEHDSTLASLKEKWKEEAQARATSQQEELESKFGTTRLDRIALDSRLGIRLELVKLCEAVFPEEYQVTVSVDRFIEFSIMVIPAGPPDAKAWAGALKEIFSRANPRWVREVIFNQKEEFWIVDQNTLLRIDWKNADVSEIAAICFPNLK